MSSTSVLSSRPYSAQSRHSPALTSPNAEKIEIPGIGTVTQHPDGVIEVAYFDGSQLTVVQPSQGGGVKFTKSDGKKIQYTAEDILPNDIRERLTQIQTVITNMMQMTPMTGKNFTSPNNFVTPVSRKCVQQPMFPASVRHNFRY